MSRVLIIEDDVSQSLELELALSEISDLVVESSVSIAGAEKLLGKHRPDIIIADILLGDEENALEWIAEASLRIPVIVITGNAGEDSYNQSKGINASTFLVKPVNTLTLKYEVEKLLESSKLVEAFVVLRDEGKLLRILVNDICWVQTEGNYSTIKTQNKKFVIKKSLVAIGQELESPYLIRVHRSTILNIKKVVKADLRTELIEMEDGSQLPLGKTYRADYSKVMREYYNTI